jgi:single-strand DNA-binding protein
MASLNKVMLIGNLTRDPEIRYTPKGSPVADLSLAVNRSYQTESGEKMDEVTYVDVVLWARLAELAGQYLQKGRPVFIEGRLQMDTWEDKATGQKRSRLRVVGESMQFLGGNPNRGQGGEESGMHHENQPYQGGYGGGNGGGYGGGNQAATPAKRYGGGNYNSGGASKFNQASSNRPQPSVEPDYGHDSHDSIQDDDIPF